MDELEGVFCLLGIKDEVAQLQAIEALLGMNIAVALHLEELRRRRRSTTRRYLTWLNLLPNPRTGTAWQKLYASRSDRAYITTMGLDVSTFNAVLQAGFAGRWETQPIPRNDVKRTGRTRLGRRSIDAPAALGLILHYLSSTAHEVALQEIFALVPSTTSRYITFGLKILLATLEDMPDARIVWPWEGEFPALNHLICRRHPRLTGAFASIDGLKLPIQTSTSQDIKNATYNGWLHEHFVSAVLVWAPTGRMHCQVALWDH